MDGEQTIESLEVEEIVYEQVIRTKEGYTNTGKFIFTKMKMMLVAKRFLVKKILSSLNWRKQIHLNRHC
ncbi:TPA: hypothetical protein ACGXIG_002508 [Listeria monocytogenes]|uniref:hypothetical protein n=1 Tax=Listeria monocytogenes TaxID=1639 RepID=UPI000BDFA504|nr:hypothetical protein [Listeria monocytogenes]EAF4603596.1 hypothetical protein [Listeria monocytogenes serotype 1/2a]EAH4406219.1 hypothetical protein [Listeria monocytogenes serotype 1/2b]EAC2315779.1 hypothetical protein [Listeria monocytogenes]EAC4745619.1 hypothetical protein [Listeria monocytogenes]EAD1591436.1 hypothetical protein [Listeria monocytogenes]